MVPKHLFELFRLTCLSLDVHCAALAPSFKPSSIRCRHNPGNRYQPVRQPEEGRPLALGDLRTMLRLSGGTVGRMSLAHPSRFFKSFRRCGVNATMDIQFILATVNWDGWINGAMIGGLIGLAVGTVYKCCFSGPGRQA